MESKEPAMSTIRTLLPWVLFLVMSLLTAFFWHQSNRRGQMIDEISGEMLQIQDQLQHVHQELLDLKAFAQEKLGTPEL